MRKLAKMTARRARPLIDVQSAKSACWKYDRAHTQFDSSKRGHQRLSHVHQFALLLLTGARKPSPAPFLGTFGTEFDMEPASLPPDLDLKDIEGKIKQASDQIKRGAAAAVACWYSVGSEART